MRRGVIICLCFSLWLFSCTGALAPKGEQTTPGSLDSTSTGDTSMSFEKFDQRLIEEVRVRKESGLAEGKRLEEIEQEMFDVTIELVEPLSIPTGMPREDALKEMEQQAEKAQAGVEDTLRSLGVIEFERQILSNSIAVTLTLGQIQEIAKRDDVKIIRLVKAEKLTP